MCVLATLKDLWFELFVIKASALADIAGGMPALFLAALQTFWGTPHHMAEAGVRLELHDTSALHVFAKLGNSTSRTTFCRTNDSKSENQYIKIKQRI